MSIWNFKLKTYHFPAPCQFYLLCQDCDQEQQIQTPGYCNESWHIVQRHRDQLAARHFGSGSDARQEEPAENTLGGRRVDPDGPASWLAHNTIPPSITQMMGALWCHILSFWSSAWGGYNVLLSIEAHLVNACSRRETTWHLRHCRLAWVSLQKLKTARAASLQGLVGQDCHRGYPMQWD
jgi:hypothetical protein